MEDAGQKKVDKETQKIERKIRAVYSQAYDEMDAKLRKFQRDYSKKNAIYMRRVEKGEMTFDEYKSWLAGQAFQSRQWIEKRSQILDILNDASNQAVKIVNGGRINAFAAGANWTAYSLEHGAGVNFGFGLYDEQTVTNLIRNDPQILPKWKIDEPKAYIWNKQKVNNCVTQGIIQGEGLDKITKRIATATVNYNQNLALTHARTAMTGAQNAGRVQRLQDAKKLGIKVVKEWMATLDGRTRDSHRAMDGEKLPVGDTWHPMKFSNGCRFPGDPQGPAREVFNCRCTLVGDLEDYPDEYQRYDNIDGVPVAGMSYKDWEKAKFGEKGAPKPKVVRPKPKTADVPEPKKSAELPPELKYLDDINDVWKKDDYKTTKWADQISDVADKYGVSRSEARKMIEDMMKRLANDADLGMRIDADVLTKVLGEGYFKNQFETNTSKGCLSFYSRTNCENKMFGVPKDAKGSDRPVYGMLMPKIDDWNSADEHDQRFVVNGPGNWYGNCMVVLDKDRVKNNVSFCLGDSLDDQNYCGSTRLADPKGVPTKSSYFNRMMRGDTHKKSGNDLVRSAAHDCDYVEYQLHGKDAHRADNIKMVYITVPKERTDAQRLIRMLEERGIPYVCTYT